MSLTSFLKDRILMILLHAICMLFMAGYLHMTGYAAPEMMVIICIWILILSVWTAVSYVQRSRYFHMAEQTLANMHKRYLLGEMLPYSHRLEDCLYREMIRKSNKSVIEKIHQIEEAGQDYREYIESWVHEIKGPITSISLICENRRKSGGEEFGVIGIENQKVENYVDSVLYYARSEQVYKDYRISRMDLHDIVCEVLEKNQRYLILNHVRAEVNCTDTVYTDGKWIGFILNQIILNSVKYRKESLALNIFSMRREQGILLIVEDNGVGIRAEELPRIFEKGYTGSNGRQHERATGMGLYLCRRLCDKLGIGIYAESDTEGTRMFLEFPVSTYISREQ